MFYLASPGFSDQDDFEAAEAALLAREITKYPGQDVTGATSGMLSSDAFAAPPGSTRVQEPLHPSSSPLRKGRRFLLWNMTGSVISRDENVFSAIEASARPFLSHPSPFLYDGSTTPP